MILKFLIDCANRETAMLEYKAGDIADISTAQALELVRTGVAEEVTKEAQPAKPKRKVTSGKNSS